MVIIQRINLGLFAVLGELGATGNWRRIAEEIWPFVDGPAVDAAGRAGSQVGPLASGLTTGPYASSGV